MGKASKPYKKQWFSEIWEHRGEKYFFFSFYRITSFLQMAAVAATADKLQLAQTMSVLNADGRIHQITTRHILPHPC